jgi:hypothetical protein
MGYKRATFFRSAGGQLSTSNAAPAPRYDALVAHAKPEHDGVELNEVVADPAEARRRLNRFGQRVANGTTVVHSADEVSERLNRGGTPSDDGPAGPDERDQSGR